MVARKIPIDERFFSKFIPEPNSGCWLWTGTVRSTGYGVISERHDEIPAHRLSLILHGVEVPHDKVVMHKCDNRCCVNPDHLMVGTHKDNTADMWAKGRQGKLDYVAIGLKLKGKTRQTPWMFGKRPPKLKCTRGHDLTGDNVIINVTTGKRKCRICNNARALNYYHSKKEQSQ